MKAHAYRRPRITSSRYPAKTKTTARVALVLCAMLALGRTALAAPAVVVFEARARQAPTFEAPVLQVLPGKTEISVSEEVTAGWRQVRLADGRTAFVPDEDIRPLSRETPSVQPLPPAQRAPASDAGRPVTYVKDLDHLAALLEKDSAIHPQAETLALRHKVAMGLMWGGLAVGGALTIGSMTFLGSRQCYDAAGEFCATKTNMTAAVGGSILTLTSLIVGYALLPTRGDLLDVINAWNERHVDEPFTLEQRL